MRRPTDKTFRVGLVCGIEYNLALLDDGWSLAIVDHRGGEKRDAGMTMLLVVPSEKLLAEASAVLDGAKAFGEVRPLLQGAEVAFRIGVVVANIGAAVGLGDAQIRH